MNRALVVAAAIAGASGVASAQPSTPAPAPQRALLLEGELGLAALSTAQNGIDPLDAVGAVAAGHLGGFLSPRLALFVLAGFTGGDAEDDFGNIVSVTEGYLGVGVRYFLSPRLWAEVSLATSRIGTRVEFDDTITFSGARFSLEGGYTVYEGQRLNLDARLGFAGGTYEDEIGSRSLWVSIGLTNR